MSLSNTPDEAFKPLAVQSLETFKDEVSNAGEDAEPDFDRFKLLIEKPTFDKEEKIDFTALYIPPEEEEVVVFEPLIKSQKNESDGETGAEPQADGEAKKASEVPEPEPQKTPEELGFEKGLEKGLAQGEAKGYEEGLAKGLEKGEKEGFEKGQQEGVEQGKTQGLEQGLEQGKAQGMEEAQVQSAEIIRSLEEMLNQVDQTVSNLVDIYEDRIVDLIKAMAEKAVLSKIEIDEETVKPLVLEALKNLVQPEEIVLNVSTDDFEYIDMVKDQFFDEVETLTHVSVRSDPSINRGGCRIETSTATVSTDPESRLETIFEAMKNARKG